MKNIKENTYKKKSGKQFQTPWKLGKKRGKEKGKKEGKK